MLFVLPLLFLMEFLNALFTRIAEDISRPFSDLQPFAQAYILSHSVSVRTGLTTNKPLGR